MALSSISPAMAAMRAAATTLPSLPQVDPIKTDGTAAAGAAGAASSNFGSMVVDSLDNLDRLHGEADQLAIEAATGDLADVHEYTIKATEAEIATQLTVAVRDKAVEAFNDIMRMQL